MLQEEVVLLLRRQSKGFVRTSTKFRGVTKDRVSHSIMMACARNASACTVRSLHMGLPYTALFTWSKDTQQPWKLLNQGHQE